MQKTSSDNVLDEIDSIPDKRIVVQIIEGLEGISDLDKDWDDLFARAVNAPPFLSRSWVRTFIRGGKIKGTPFFILAWCQNKLVALFPLAVRKHLLAKIAVPIGTGIPSYLGLLLDPDYRPVTEDIAETIISKRIFDVYYSEDLSSEDPGTNDLIDKLAQKGCFCRQISRNPCCHVKLGCSFDEYFKNNASSKSRQNLLRRERRLFESGNVTVRHYVNTEVTPEVLLRIATIEDESWLKRRGAAVLKQPFYQELLLKAAQAGFGHVWLMTIEGEDAAFEYIYVTHNRLQFGFRAFKLKYSSSVSIGQILFMHVIRDACGNGILSMDIGHGEADYKRFWASNSYFVNRVVAGCGCIGYLIAMTYYAAWCVGKIEWFRSYYRRLRMVLRGFRQKTTNV
jgi:CelD/BcsL family acetyltransferase involved in cellulose biosynthesis